MKADRASAQSLAASVAVLVILLSGSVYAFSIGGSLSGNAQNAPSPLEDTHSCTSTSTTSTTHSQEHTGTSTTSTSSCASIVHDRDTSTTTSGKGGEEKHGTTTHTESEHTSQTTTRTDTKSSMDKSHPHGLTFRIVALGTNTGHGEAYIQIQGTSLKVGVALVQAAASATYNVVLLSTPVATPGSSSPSVPPTCTGTSLGTIVTGTEGNGQALLQTTLSPGYYELGLVVCTTSTPAAPAYVSDPAAGPALIAQGTQEHDSEAEALQFHLSPIGTASGKGQAALGISGTTVAIYIELDKASKSTTFGVDMVAIPLTASTSTTFSTTSPTITTTTTTSAPNCGTPIGTFVTDGEGSGEAELSATLSPGTYALGIVLCSGSTPTFVSDPATRTATLPPTSEGNNENSNTHSDTETSNTHESSSTQQSSSTKQSETESESTTVSAVTTGEHDEGDIKTAEASKTIPAIVSYSNSGVSLHPIDPQFSISASQLSNNGLLVSISAKNVTGSRVLEVNLTGSQWTASSLQGLKVTLDGTPIAEAASLSQVLSSTSADPARYIILVTSAGLQLLVSIPHFSLHIIQILPSVATALALLVANGPLLLTGLIVFSGFAAALYSRRKKFYALVL